MPAKTILELVRTCDSFPYEEDAIAEYYRFYLLHDNQPRGFVHRSIVKKSISPNPSFTVIHTERKVILHEVNCSKAIQQVVDHFLNEATNERYPQDFVIPFAPQRVRINYPAVHMFGTTAETAHLIAYTSRPLEVFIRRARHADPRLNTTINATVNGRVPRSPLDTLRVEAFEKEPVLHSWLHLQHFRSCGVLSHILWTSKFFGLDHGEFCLPSVAYAHEVELSEAPNAIPDEFDRVSIARLQHLLREDAFSPTDAMVMVDFMVRHGILTADSDFGFAEMSMRMHRRLPFGGERVDGSRGREG